MLTLWFTYYYEKNEEKFCVAGFPGGGSYSMGTKVSSFCSACVEQFLPAHVCIGRTGVSERTATCQDTLRYPLVKQATMGGTTGYNLFDLWQADNEAISQAFTL